MKTTHQITNQADLERLIERYFDGETSLQEERMLREVLGDCPWNSDAIDEARFAMGYFAAHVSQQQRRSRKVVRNHAIGIAASIAIILGIGALAFWQLRPANDICIAYVNGKTVNNDDAVMALIEQDLNAMDDASQSMAAQLSSIGEALELENE